MKRHEMAQVGETANVEVPEKNVNKNPELVTSKLESNALDIQNKTNIMTSADEIVTDDERDDLEEDIVVTHL